MCEVAIKVKMHRFNKQVVAEFISKQNLLLLVILALIFRMVDISFPAFTADEARVAYRGFTLATEGRDEFGRVYPLIFNGSQDYQLPAVSYVTASSIFVFGKSDLGARLPFIAIGIALVLLVYRIGFLLLGKKGAFYSALLIAFSPPLIFLSRVPNETILLVFLFSLLFYLIIRGKVNWIVLFLLSGVSLLTSKYAWFILPPFVFITLFFYGDKLRLKEKIRVAVSVLLLSIVAAALFLQVPQSGRSLMENNFILLTDITIQNGVNRLRGQGIESGWPAISGKVFFNKLTIFPVGFLHWLSNISPNVYFGQLDSSGKFSFLGLGAWAKFLIFPAMYGLYILVREQQKKLIVILPYIPILTFPALFIYPDFSPELVVLTLPLMAFVIAFGLLQMRRNWAIIILFLMIVEVSINILYKTPDIKNTNNLRPYWIKKVVIDAQTQSKSNQVILSDDLVSDISPYIGWYSDFIPSQGYLNVEFPYRVRQSLIGNIVLQGYNEEIDLCGTRERRTFFLSPKTLKMMEARIDIKNLKPDYFDGLQKPAVYRLPYEVCLE